MSSLIDHNHSFPGKAQEIHLCDTNQQTSTGTYNFFSVRVFDSWNNVPSEVKKTASRPGYSSWLIGDLLKQNSLTQAEGQET